MFSSGFIWLEKGDIWIYEEDGPRFTLLLSYFFTQPVLWGANARLWYKAKARKTTKTSPEIWVARSWQQSDYSKQGQSVPPFIMHQWICHHPQIHIIQHMNIHIVLINENLKLLWRTMHYSVWPVTISGDCNTSIPAGIFEVHNVFNPIKVHFDYFILGECFIDIR